MASTKTFDLLIPCKMVSLLCFFLLRHVMYCLIVGQMDFMNTFYHLIFIQQTVLTFFHSPFDVHCKSGLWSCFKKHMQTECLHTFLSSTFLQKTCRQTYKCTINPQFQTI